MSHEDIYSPNFVRALFNEMSGTYGVTNFISSLGFCRRWRQQCVGLAPIRPGMTVYDLMTGMGECWHLIARRLEGSGRLLALDLSDAMCRRAMERREKFAGLPIDVVRDDFLVNRLPDASADAVVSCFGLKTFSESQRNVVAREINRILKPGGCFSLLEISVPTWAPLRRPYMFYLNHVIPLIGKLMLGNPDNYRMLGVYTANFGSCATMQAALADCGLDVELRRFFFGCATALCGSKPAAMKSST